jgi:hypothetical protein
MSGPHAVRHSTAEPQPEPDPVEVTEPVDVVAWLRALPVGTVLLSADRVAWQVRADGGPADVVYSATGGYFYRGDEPEMTELANEGPFLVLWMPPGGGAS